LSSSSGDRRADVCGSDAFTLSRAAADSLVFSCSVPQQTASAADTIEAEFEACFRGLDVLAAEPRVRRGPMQRPSTTVDVAVLSVAHLDVVPAGLDPAAAPAHRPEIIPPGADRLDNPGGRAPAGRLQRLSSGLRMVPVDEVEGLAFDHDRIVDLAAERLRP
jgi:hypothetical protein